MNSRISSYLLKYIEYKDPQFAVMLTGEWGCGKTHFVKGWKESVENIKGKKYKPLYISLYGMHSLNELRANINRQLHPFLTSNFVKNAKKLANGLAKTIIKCDFGDDQNPIEVSYELDLLPLFQSNNKEIEASGKILIFDDFERCQIDRKDLMGFINFFVEHCACKVIVLCHEEKMLIPSGKRIITKEPIKGKDYRWIAENDTEPCQDGAYREFKEKTIGITFEVKPDVEAAIDQFISIIASDPQQLLLNMKPYLHQMLEQTGNKNLRVLRQCFLDFNSVVKEIPVALYMKQHYIPVMRKFLLDLVITSFEVKAGNELFDEPDELVYSFLPGTKSESFSSLVEHYSPVPTKLGIQVLDYDSVKKIVQFLRTGFYPVNELISLIGKFEVEVQPWEKLTYYWNLTNEDFIYNYKLSAKKLKKRNINSLDELIGITFKLVNFDNMGIMPASKTLKRDFLVCAGRFMDQAKPLDELMLFKRDVISRLQYYRFDSEIALWKDIVSSLMNDIEDRASRQKSRMVSLMENLNSSALTELARLIDTEEPISRRNYTSSPIFNGTDSRKVVAGIMGLSNKDRVLFRDILRRHYSDLNVANYDDFKFYDAEIANVTSIVAALKRKRLTAIDKYSVGLVIKQFERLILRESDKIE
ncbi:MAG: hypothetical protein HUJ97_00425 [Bacteroidales bacterium]|nr:hypothetical protein [Bacteroidales bacterium]MCF0190032.1 hypothetical protein [Marinilabiliaceae bacterium]